MIAYNSGITAEPPITQDMRQRALDGLMAQGALQRGSQFSDIYNSRAQSAAVDLERAAVRANNQHMANAQDAQSQVAMQGGNLMQTGQQNAYGLENRQRGIALDYANQLLGGMNSLLAGLYS